jgi:hypothetical protein
MRLLGATASSLIWILVFAGGASAQDRLIPAGTLLQCTMNEPNFSSATTAIGDPVLCHLKTLEEFGRPAFPRGAMLGGHLEEAKDPGHLWGKGHLTITFDRVVLPYGDLPVPAKVIQAKGFKVDKTGDINGKGHAKRDVVEWMIPPLWPWKVISLPMRGPRPRLKGEEPLQLRLMDDITVPATLAYGSIRPDRPSYGTSAQPSAFSASHGKPRMGFTVLVLKSNDVYHVTKFWLDRSGLKFELSSGEVGMVDASEVDWLRTAEMTSSAKFAASVGLSAAQ